MTEDIEVRILSSDKRGVVKRSSQTGPCRVLLLDSNQEQDVPAGDLEPVRPEKKDKVKILSGEFAGQIGALIGIDQQDGIVKLAGSSDFKILRMSLLAKYLQG
jgi:transcription elongation factor SPT5